MLNSTAYSGDRKCNTGRGPTSHKRARFTSGSSSGDWSCDTLRLQIAPSGNALRLSAAEFGSAERYCTRCSIWTRALRLGYTITTRTQECGSQSSVRYWYLLLVEVSLGFSAVRDFGEIWRWLARDSGSAGQFCTRCSKAR